MNSNGISSRRVYAKTFPEGVAMFVPKDDALFDLDPDAITVGAKVVLAPAAILATAGVRRVEVSGGQTVTIERDGDFHRLTTGEHGGGAVAFSGTVAWLLTGVVTEIR